jgi:hypothetical protein
VKKKRTRQGAGPEPLRDDRRRAALLSLVLVAATVAVYANSISAPFVFDDIPVIVENQQLGTFWPLGPVLLGVRGAPTGGRPVTSLSFHLNELVAGRSPTGYHAVNILIHLIAGLTLFAVLRRMLRSADEPKGSSNAAVAMAFAVSLLWLVHPLQTESVTYISQRAESLMGLFCLVALYCAVRGFEGDRPERWFRRAALASLLSVLSKEVGVVVPLIILAYDRLAVSESLKGALKRHWKLYAGLALTWVAAGALQLTAPRGYSVSLSDPDLLPWAYFQRQIVALPMYLKLVFWPSPLILDYGYPPVPPLPRLLAAGFFLVALIALSVWALRRKSLAGLAGVVFFLVLAPSSTVIPIVTEIVAEHRMYLPLGCVLAVAVGGAFELSRVARERGLRLSPPNTRIVGWALLGAAALGFGALTWQRNRIYQSDVALWRDTVAKVPGNARALSNLGWALLRAGDAGEALGYFRTAVSHRPGFYDANAGAATALERLGGLGEAVTYMRRAVAANPDSGWAYEGLMRMLVKLGRWDEALAVGKACVEHFPQEQRANYLYGTLLSKVGRTVEARAYLERARELGSHHMAGTVPSP